MSERIPQSVLDDANADIVGVIKGYLPALKKTGKNWSACCPFHEEKSPSFTVNESKGFYYCFGCGAGGSAIDFVTEMNPGLGFRDVIKSILGDIKLEPSSVSRASAAPRAIRCELPGHAENRERAAQIMKDCDAQENHIYLLRNNTAPKFGCFTLKGSLLVPLINNIGEQVNVAAITSKGISYAAGKPSFGSTAILEPEGEHDGKTIICCDYAHAWRIWWAQSGRSKVLCTMEAENFTWMLGACKDRFTHVGCDPSEADHYADEGMAVVAVPLDPYQRIDRKVSAA